MTKIRSDQSSGRWYRSLARVFVGLVLVSTGIGKGLDVSGFVSVLDSYRLQPHWASVLLAYSLPLIELGTGICLLTSIQRLAAVWTAVGLHIVMICVVVVTLIRGIEVPNCGCFGVFFARPLTITTFFEDAFMLAMSLIVLLQARKIASGLHDSPSPEDGHNG